MQNEKVSLEVRVKDFETKVNSIEDKIHLIPEIESELVSLNRGYDITKGKYNELLTRREQARLSQSADLTADDIQFKVVDPPRVPLEASGPNRVILLSVVTFFSLAAGVGLAFCSQPGANQCFSGNQLTRLTGYPVFGLVAMSNIEEVKKGERLQVLFLRWRCCAY